MSTIERTANGHTIIASTLVKGEYIFNCTCDFNNRIWTTEDKAIGWMSAHLRSHATTGGTK